MRDSREKGAGMRDQDPPFQTLLEGYYFSRKLHTSKEGGTLLSGGPLLSGFNSMEKKLTLLSGSRYFRGARYYRNSTVSSERTFNPDLKSLEDRDDPNDHMETRLQFYGPNYLGAWNRLTQRLGIQLTLESRGSCSVNYY